MFDLLDRQSERTRDRPQFSLAMTSIREQIIRFVEHLRARGVRISTAETMDAMRGVAAAGFGRAAIREALAATLVKDEGDRPAFDQAFADFFGAAEAGEPREATSRDRHDRIEGRGHGGESIVESPSRPEPAKPGASASQRPEQAHLEQVHPEQAHDDEAREKPDEAESTEDGQNPRDESDRSTRESGREARGEQRKDDASDAQIAAQLHARLRAAERKPFANYSDLDYELAREALKPLMRRFRVRMGRRLRLAHRGRIDFRRTIRASIQHGGALLDLRFRSRLPRHVDLLILADISGSVRYSSTLMLELMAGARRCFRHVTSLVYIDRIADADFEENHLVMTPALDLYARSDFGRVLGELWRRREELLGRATLLVIMGDGRNNRRPARADLLREIARCCRAVIWLNPEELNRWGTGDSAIGAYQREVRVLLPARNLRELEARLLRVS